MGLPSKLCQVYSAMLPMLSLHIRHALRQAKRQLCWQADSQHPLHVLDTQVADHTASCRVASVLANSEHSLGVLTAVSHGTGPSRPRLPSCTRAPPPSTQRGCWHSGRRPSSRWSHAAAGARPCNMQVAQHLTWSTRSLELGRMASARLAHIIQCLLCSIMHIKGVLQQRMK